MLLRHPTIYLDHTGRTTDALLIRDGVVAAVGPAAVERHRDDEPVEEPEAACLFPGLTDAHAHLWGLGRRAGSVELSGAELSELGTLVRGGGDLNAALRTRAAWCWVKQANQTQTVLGRILG